MQQAAENCREGLATLRAYEDPRQAKDVLFEMSRSLADLSGVLDRPSVASYLFGGLSDSATAVATARASVRTAAASVDALLRGVDLAAEALARVGSNSRADELFRTEFAIVGQLLDARARVDEHVGAVLTVLNAVLPTLLESAPAD